jgi:predicted NAD/FAD-binding protein
MTSHRRTTGVERLDIAVVKTGISGLSAAWLPGERHNVTVFEASAHIGGNIKVEFESPSGPPVAVLGITLSPSRLECVRRLDTEEER